MSSPSRFSAWFSWTDRERYEGIKYPGVYVIALSEVNLAGSAFSWRKEIVYIGMTNARLGLKGRLRQFHSTITMVRSQHGGAERFLYAHRDYELIADQLFVSLLHMPCNPSQPLATDLRQMGQVTKAEYDAWADYYDAIGALPKFNDKTNNPKFKF